jgi:hypothetical protein
LASKFESLAAISAVNQSHFTNSLNLQMIRKYLSTIGIALFVLITVRGSGNQINAYLEHIRRNRIIESDAAHRYIKKSAFASSIAKISATIASVVIAIYCLSKEII